MKKLIFLLLAIRFSLITSFAQQWYPMGVGVTSQLTYHNVFTINEFNGEIIIGGQFKRSGSNVLNSIGRWDGYQWQPIGLGAWKQQEVDSAGWVSNFTFYKSQLYCTGLFEGTGGNYIMDINHFSKGIARWNGSDWFPLYPPPTVSGLNYLVGTSCAYNNNLYVGGVFSAGMDTAGFHSVRNIARWNDTIFSSPGFLFSDYGDWVGYCKSLMVFDNKLIAGGTFTTIDTAPYGTYKFIAAYNDTVWSPLGNGFNAPVYSTAVFNGELYAAGIFTANGDNSQLLNHVAKWDGTQWLPVGEGLNDTIGRLYVDTIQNKLYAGGVFIQTGLGIQAKHIAEWTGSIWQEVNGGTNGTVTAIYSKDSILYVGGSFSQVGNGIPVNNIAAYGYKNPYVGVNELEVSSLQFQIYPNPSNGEIYLSYNIKQNGELRILDITGRLIANFNLPLNQTNLQISLPSINSGMYLYQVYIINGELSKTGKYTISK